MFPPGVRTYAIPGVLLVQETGSAPRIRVTSVTFVALAATSTVLSTSPHRTPLPRSTPVAFSRGPSLASASIRGCSGGGDEWDRGPRASTPVTSKWDEATALQSGGVSSHLCFSLSRSISYPLALPPPPMFFLSSIVIHALALVIVTPQRTHHIPRLEPSPIQTR